MFIPIFVVVGAIVCGLAVVIDASRASSGCTSHGGCSCPGHLVPGVSHIVACCDRPHIEYEMPKRKESRDSDAGDR